MFKIIDKKILADKLNIRITQLEIKAEEISKKALAGQFVVLMVSENGERIPLTIVENNRKEGTITLIFQEVGLTTKLLGNLEKGDSVYALLGPLGNPTEIKKYGNVILIGGGVGIAEIYPVAKALKEKNNFIVAILGSKTKELLILEDKIGNIVDKLYITTDDGSYGRKGFVTDVLEEILERDFNLIYAVGPIPMMRRVSFIAKNFNVKTIVSLNTLMVDATGMCGCCRVSVDGKTKFSCVDGPEFEADKIDWDELENRSKMYIDKESHICKLYNL